MRNFALSLLLLTTQIVTGQTMLEQIMCHPIESNLASAKDGKNLAWVINDHGKRNIIVKTGTDLPRMLTDFQQDDGQELSQLTFSPNGLKLLFVRGGASNRAGQAPNPANIFTGVDQAIYFKDIGNKSAPAKIAQGNSPVFYRDGLKFLFSKGGQIYESTLEINAIPIPLFVARGFNSDPQFSPIGA